MKMLRPAFALVFALGFVSCEKSPETQKAAEDAKKAGEAVMRPPSQDSMPPRPSQKLPEKLRPKKQPN